MKKLIYSILKSLLKGLLEDFFDDMVKRAEYKAAMTKTEYDDQLVAMIKANKSTLLGLDE